MYYLLILITSLSLRTANLSEQPFDYELVTGLHGKQNIFTLMIERENGNKYYGKNINLNYKYLNFTDYMKTAKQINSQKFSFLYPFKYYKFGVTYSLEDWQASKLLLTITYKRNFCELKYSKGFGREHIDIDMNKNIKLTNIFSVTPLISIKKYDSNLFYQFKLALSVILFNGKEGNNHERN